MSFLIIIYKNMESTPLTNLKKIKERELTDISKTTDTMLTHKAINSRSFCSHPCKHEKTNRDAARLFLKFRDINTLKVACNRI